MGRKKSKNPPPATEIEAQDDVDADFAASLLAEMGIDEPQVQEASPSPGDSAKDIQVTATPVRTKRNRRKEKLAQRQEDVEIMMQQAEKEAAEQPRYREVEIEQLREKFKDRNLTEIDIRPDGNCLFSAISDQLESRAEISITPQDLRQRAADYILANRDDFIPFLLSEETGELRDIDEYCRELTSTPMWGGEMEVLALSNSFERPIEVLQAGPSHVVGDHFTQEKLLVSYYTKIYGLGAHYNSVRDSL